MAKGNSWQGKQGLSVGSYTKLERMRKKFREKTVENKPLTLTELAKELEKINGEYFTPETVGNFYKGGIDENGFWSKSVNKELFIWIAKYFDEDWKELCKPDITSTVPRKPVPYYAETKRDLQISELKVKLRQDTYTAVNLFSRSGSGKTELVLRLIDEDTKSAKAQFKGRRDKERSVSIIRYADDFVILHEDINTLNKCIEVITQWLNDIGLELKPSKTRITHTLNSYKKEKAGFDFLRFNVKQQKKGKYTSGRNRKGSLLGFKTIITPSKDAQKRHYKKLAEIIDQSKGQSQITLIGRLNPVIRGWCNYYANVVSTKVFDRLTYITKYKLFRWGKKRHRNKGMKWVMKKYFQTIGSRRWVFATRTKDNPFPTYLISHYDTKIYRYVKVKGDASPYDGNLVYWSTRQGKHPKMPTRTAFLLKKQKGKCNWCELYLRDGDVIELDHIIPKSKGGKDEYKNWQLLHRHCHDKKTSIDGSLDIPFKPVKLPPNWKW